MRLIDRLIRSLSLRSMAAASLRHKPVITIGDILNRPWRETKEFIDWPSDFPGIFTHSKIEFLARGETGPEAIEYAS